MMPLKKATTMEDARAHTHAPFSCVLYLIMTSSLLCARDASTQTGVFIFIECKLSSNLLRRSMCMEAPFSSLARSFGPAINTKTVS